MGGRGRGEVRKEGNVHTRHICITHLPYILCTCTSYNVLVHVLYIIHVHVCALYMYIYILYYMYIHAHVHTTCTVYDKCMETNRGCPPLPVVLFQRAWLTELLRDVSFDLEVKPGGG